MKKSDKKFFLFIAVLIVIANYFLPSSKCACKKDQLVVKAEEQAAGCPCGQH